MAETFERPTDVIVKQDTFGATEVGLTNPKTSAFTKLLDNGDVEIIVEDGLGMIMSASNHTITFLANAIRFITTDTNGLVWNKTAFNEQATSFNEASLISLTDNNLSQLFNGVEHYLPGN